jgi:5-methylcytosine-specific restriction endonuclease McrA
MRFHSKERAKIESRLKRAKQDLIECFDGCFNCGSWRSPTVAHLVPRSRRRDLIADPANLIVLCIECHHQLDHSGNRDLLRRWPEILEKVRELDEEYYELIK